MDKLDELLDFLAKDEEEAIKGYDDVIAKLGDESVVEQLKKIRDEEVAHLDFLRKAKENPNLKYVDPSDGKDEDTVEAEKMFGMKFEKKGE